LILKITIFSQGNEYDEYGEFLDDENENGGEIY
jgi:hypothetical protein